MIINTELANSIGHLQKDKWETPKWLFDQLDHEFHFTLDPCCEVGTAKCSRFYTPEDNGLLMDWDGERVFVNPPYSRGNIDKWVKKCFDQRNNASVIVGLFPVSTSADWFHRYVWNVAEIRFIKRRVRFVGAPFTAPFSSMICIYDGSKYLTFQP